ncbi:hypothetical protein ACIGO7_35255 [Streptomyces virginiae]|uniref:hypothetical protein n=1 Tax=Streptomyces virginiae TaxID=1961 RepID=UPI00344F1B6A
MRRQDQFPGQLSDVGRTLAAVRRELRERAANFVPRLRRSDNTTAATLGTTWAWHDRSGNEVVAEDADAWGLGRPWLPIPMTPALTFTATSWTTMYRGTWQVQNPVILAEYSVAAPASTVAQARLVLDVGGTITQLGSTTTATAGTEVSASFTVDPIGHGLAHGNAGSLYIQVQRTSGTGTCTVSNWGLWSRSSS